MPRKLRRMTLRQIRLGLGLSQRELERASITVLGGKGINHSVIYRVERGDAITELTASRLLLTINYLYQIRGRPELTIDDVAWTISDRKTETPEA